MSAAALPTSASAPLFTKPQRQSEPRRPLGPILFEQAGNIKHAQATAAESIASNFRSGTRCHGRFLPPTSGLSIVAWFVLRLPRLRMAVFSRRLRRCFAIRVA